MKAKPVFSFTALAGATGLALISLASPSNALAASKTKQYTRTFTVDAVGFLDPRPVVVEVPTMGVVELLGCFGPPDYSLRTRLLSFDDSEPFFGVGTLTDSLDGEATSRDQTAGTYSGGGGTPLIANFNPPQYGNAGHWEWSLWRNNGDNKRGAQVSIDGWNDPFNGKCHFRATVLQND